MVSKGLTVTKGRIAKEVAVWIITLLLALVCLRSGWLKVTGNIFWVRDFHRWGYPDWLLLLEGARQKLSLVSVFARVADEDIAHEDSAKALQPPA